MKRLFLLFFSALLCTAVSAHSFEVDGIYYYITSSSDLTVRVTFRGSDYNEYSNEYSGSVVIPEKVTYDSKEYSVTSIGYYAFRDCSGLTSVTIPNSVTSIGYSAFYGCSGMTSVTIPNSVTSIEYSAFYGCSGLTAVHITDLSAWCKIKFDNLSSNPTDYAHHLYLNGEEIINLVIPDDVTSIGDEAFRGCSGLTNVIIPNSVTSIGNSAFYGCSGLASVTIPNSVTNIGNSAFYGCSGLTNVTIPNSVTSIGNSAFYGCSGLTNVTIPNSVTSIGNSAFEGCSSLKNLIIDEGEESLKLGYNSYTEGLFYDCPIESLYIGRNLTYDTENSCGYSPFYNLKNLSAVTIGNSVTSIGDYAFIGCSGLLSVTIPNSVTSIGESAFWGCSGLLSVTIPNSVTSIGDDAFEGCSGLTSVTIPNSVTSIGNEAFCGCSGLTSITIPNSVTSIGESAFSGCSGLTSVTIPNSVTSIGRNAFSGCSGLTSVTIPNSVTSIEYGAFFRCYGLTSVTIPNSVTSIGIHAFEGCSGLTSVTIPNSVTSIGERAFYGCSGMTSVTIPNSVTSIGFQAFESCSGMTSVRIEDGESTLPLSNYTFDLCPLTTLYLGRNISYTVSNSSTPFSGKKKLSAVTIGNNVTNIGEYLFYGCSALASVTILESCKTIQRNAFRDCNNLQELTLPSTCVACYDYSFYGCSSLKKINCQAETPPVVYANTFSGSIYTKATLNVPEGSADKYKAANIWNKFTNMTVGGVVPDEPKQCAAPVITYADGKLQCTCETEGAKFKYMLTDTDIKTEYTDMYNGSVNLSACYTIKAYAYAEGYTNSEQVTAMLYWIDGSDVSTNINQTEMRGVMATCSGGIITVSGLAENETVEFYTASGSLLYTATAQNGTISYAPSATGVVIVKIGKASIKVTV